jgi:hypothetical protein
MRKKLYMMCVSLALYFLAVTIIAVGTQDMELTGFVAFIGLFPTGLALLLLSE